MSLFIVRHGRTEANAAGLLLGCRLDPALDDLGVRQAQALAAVLAGAARVVASPLLRTRQTASALALPTTVDHRWAEIDYGTLDGTPLAEVPGALWEAWRADVHFRPNGGESLASVGERVRRACDDLAEEAMTHDIVVVTHVSPIKAAVAWALEVGDEVAWHMFCAPASITEISTTGGRRCLHTFNVTGHLHGT
ncbi:MAG: histidine phosphatase family protein [Acidimicrobiales bacterium]